MAGLDPGIGAPASALDRRVRPGDDDLGGGGRARLEYRQAGAGAMTPAEILEVGRDAIFVLIQVAGPVMSVGLAVGLFVSVFQSITQIQEMTLAFVPKILSIFISLMLFLPFMINTLVEFMERIAERIVGTS